MIYSLTGKILHNTPDLCVIECGGVGYACKTTASTMQQQLSGRDSATLYTYLAVREDAVELFGFADQAELECFRLLTSVSGVGSKFALAILSAMTSDQVALAIASQDYASFTRIKGVGNKIAQRIVMELKDKISKDYSYLAGGDTDLGRIARPSSNVADAVEALVVLGYSQSEAASCLGKMDGSLSVEELIKRGLKELSGSKF